MGKPHVNRSELVAMGIDPEFNVNRSMAEFYVLERLTADGSKKAGRMLWELEQAHSPTLLNYLSAICGGELRHGPRMWGGWEGCDGWNCSGSDNTDCTCCGEGEDYHGGNEYFCKHCNYEKVDHESCDEDECDEKHCPWQNGLTFEGGGDPCGCYCPNEPCDECLNVGNTDWDADLPTPMVEWLNSQSSMSARSGSWLTWQKFYFKVGPDALTWAARAFYELDWGGESYGGKNWGVIAEIASDFAHGKLSARLFMDRCWTLEHNGGNIFDKMFDYESCRSMGKALQKQAEDDYGFLQTWCSTSVRNLWNVRDYKRFALYERDPVWLGNQRTFDVEVDW